MRRELVVAPGAIVSRALGERREAGRRVAGAEDIDARAAIASLERERLREGPDRLRIAPAVEPGDLVAIGHALDLRRQRRPGGSLLRGNPPPLGPPGIHRGPAPPPPANPQLTPTPYPS